MRTEYADSHRKLSALFFPPYFFSFPLLPFPFFLAFPILLPTRSARIKIPLTGLVQLLRPKNLTWSIMGWGGCFCIEFPSPESDSAADHSSAIQKIPWNHSLSTLVGKNKRKPLIQAVNQNNHFSWLFFNQRIFYNRTEEMFAISSARIVSRAGTELVNLAFWAILLPSKLDTHISYEMHILRPSPTHQSMAYC